MGYPVISLIKFLNVPQNICLHVRKCINCVVVSSWYLHRIFMSSLRYLHMFNSIYIFLMNVAGIECLYSIILTCTEFETCELGSGHQHLLQLVCPSIFHPDRHNKRMALLSGHVWHLLRTLFKDLFKLSLVLQQKLKLSTIILAMVYGLS